MSHLVRFSISLEEDLLKRFDFHINEQKYKNRSEALRDLIREDLVSREWQKNEKVAGTITLVYEHHKRGLVQRLTALQHEYNNIIISTQHIHLDHDNCLEVIIVQGKAHALNQLANKLKAVKGVKFGNLAMATRGKELI
ncbi:MAG: nickel-responsive transcriptional regulator NikR [Atribacterota bacterium]|nr:nickel-responsive transcriptional regulator NikR [Atribacterota bacterium]